MVLHDCEGSSAGSGATNQIVTAHDGFVAKDYGGYYHGNTAGQTVAPDATTALELYGTNIQHAGTNSVGAEFTKATGCTFNSTVASGIYWRTTGDVTDCVFTGDTATDRRLEIQANATIQRCTFDRCAAYCGIGGGSVTDLSIRNCRLKNLVDAGDTWGIIWIDTYTGRAENLATAVKLFLSALANTTSSSTNTPSRNSAEP